jgi:hypothetical protein
MPKVPPSLRTEGVSAVQPGWQEVSMKRLDIEWRHFERDGETCLRCAATGKTLQQVMAELKQELGAAGVQVSFTETSLPESRMAESNVILFNGVPLEELLAGVASGTSDCPSCACLVGRKTACRTVEYAGRSYEEIPEELIRKAAWRAVGEEGK